MKRIGYDADTQQYLFSDPSGLYQSAPGERYGVLRPFSESPIPRTPRRSATAVGERMMLRGLIRYETHV